MEGRWKNFSRTHHKFIQFKNRKKSNYKKRSEGPSVWFMEENDGENKKEPMGKNLEGCNHKIVNNDCSEVELKGDKNR